MMFGYRVDLFYVIKNQAKDNILFFYPEDTDMDTQLNVVGITIGIVNFFQTFDTTTKILCSDQFDYYFHLVKPDEKYIICCRLKKRMKEIPSGDPSPLRRKTIKTHGSDHKSYIELGTSRYFPKNNYILLQLKLSGKMYKLFYNGDFENRMKLSKFYLKFLSRYFLRKNTLILLDFLQSIPTSEIEDGKRWLRIFHFLNQYVFESEGFVEHVIVFFNNRMIINHEILDQKIIHYILVYLQIMESPNILDENFKTPLPRKNSNNNNSNEKNEKEENGEIKPQNSSFNVNSFKSILKEEKKEFYSIYFDGKKKWLNIMKLMNDQLKIFFILSRKQKPPFKRLIFTSLCKLPLVIEKSPILETLNCIRIDYSRSLRSLSFNYNNFFLVYLLNDFLSETKNQKQVIFNLTKNFWFILLRRSNSQFCFIILKEKNISLSQINKKIVQAIKMK